MENNSNILNYFYEHDATLSKREQIATRLRELRASTGLTQKEFAKRHNFSNASVSSWEQKNGKNVVPSLDKLVILADYYNCDIAFLLGETGPSFDIKNISMKLIREETGLSGKALQIIQREASSSKRDLDNYNDELQKMVAEEYVLLEKYYKDSSILINSAKKCGLDLDDRTLAYLNEKSTYEPIFQYKVEALKEKYQSQLLNDWKDFRTIQLQFIDYFIRKTDEIMSLIQDYQHIVISKSRLESRDDYQDILAIFNATNLNKYDCSFVLPDGSFKNTESDFFNALSDFFKKKRIDETNDFISSSFDGDNKDIVNEDLEKIFQYDLLKEIEETSSSYFNELNFTDTYNLLKNGARDLRALEYDLSTTFMSIVKDFMKSEFVNSNHPSIETIDVEVS